MCGRYSNTRTSSDVALGAMLGRLGAPPPGTGTGFERFNVAPTEQVAAVVADPSGRRVTTLRWGLVPPWAERRQPSFAMINARCETVRARPAYRGLVESAAHRCLVLADGWYEWQGPEDPRQPRRPVHFSLASDGPFCFAGLWTDATGSCTIVTCAANELARPIHDRMPVVLSEPAAQEAWLDDSLDGETVTELLAPLPAAALAVRAANPVVNRAGYDAPDCLEPELTLL